MINVSRRVFALSVGAGALGSLLPSRLSRADPETKGFRLSAKPVVVNLLGDSHPNTAVWAYNDVVPGTELRVRQGDPVQISVQNQLTEGTTVHWHGIRLPNAMDGVPGFTQPPIRPGEAFTYEFTPPDAGTFWYHPHADTLQQLGRGLAGPLIVEEREPIVVDRDLLWFIEDWRLDEGAQIASGFGDSMEAAMAGRVGNTVTINGRVPDRVSVTAGERLRLRVVNASLARIVSLRFADHSPVVVAYDGQPCDPHTPERGRVVLGPAMRADLILDMGGVPGRNYPVTDDFYGAYRLVELAYGSEKPTSDKEAGPSPRLPQNPLTEPDLRAAERHEIALQGGMMGGMGMMDGRGMMGRMPMMGVGWTINGMSMTGDGQPNMPHS